MKKYTYTVGIEFNRVELRGARGTAGYTDADREWNRKQLAHGVQGISCTASRAATQDEIMEWGSQYGMYAGSVEVYANKARNIFLKPEPGAAATAFVRIRPVLKPDRRNIIQFASSRELTDLMINLVNVPDGIIAIIPYADRQSFDVSILGQRSICEAFRVEDAVTIAETYADKAEALNIRGVAGTVIIDDNEEL